MRGRRIRFGAVALALGVTLGCSGLSYRALSAELAESEARARDVRERIAPIEQVAGDLFEEWEREIAEISRADLRSKSRAQRKQTQASAIASLEKQAAGIQRDVDALVRDLSASIQEADAFLATLEQGGA